MAETNKCIVCGGSFEYSPPDPTCEDRHRSQWDCIARLRRLLKDCLTGITIHNDDCRTCNYLKNRIEEALGK